MFISTQAALNMYNKRDIISVLALFWPPPTSDRNIWLFSCCVNHQLFAHYIYHLVLGRSWTLDFYAFFDTNCSLNRKQLARVLRANQNNKSENRQSELKAVKTLWGAVKNRREKDCSLLGCAYEWHLCLYTQTVGKLLIWQVSICAAGLENNVDPC